MKTKLFITAINISMCAIQCFAQDTAYINPDTSGSGWVTMFNTDLSNAIFPADVWIDSSSIITATKDEAMWSKDEYHNFVLDLDFMNANGTNSGVMAVSYTHLRAHETGRNIVCRLLLEKK